MTVKVRKLGLLLAVVGAFAVPRVAVGVDGVIEINQARALAGDVPAGDNPGFPVTITHGGSYRLTSDLVVGSANGIEIKAAADLVALDLNGFAIKHTGSACCAAISAETGVRRIFVRNGLVLDFDWGIYATYVPASVESFQAVGANTASWGISVGDQSMVTDSVVDSFAGGIEMGAGSVVRNCTLKVGNSTIGNGIFASDGSSVIGTTILNANTGVWVGTGVTLRDNTVRGCLSLGFYFAGTNSGYAGNVLTGNNGGNGQPQIGGTGSGFQLGSNVCGNGTCPP